jgi:uncharacterized protein (TIGR03000 family)
MSLKKSLFVTLVAVAAISLTAENSNAFFGLFGGGGSCGSHGGGGGSWGGGWGSRGGWGSCGSYGGGGSWGGGSYGGGWGSHGGGWGSGGGGSWGSGGGYYSNSGYYSGGYARRGGVVYGRIVATESPRNVTVAQTNAAKTRLTLHVPAEASVNLAGIQTKQTGEVRQFTTTKLASGQIWDDYKVVVTMERDGQTLREERTIRLTGGQSQELSINFDSQQLAQR